MSESTVELLNTGIPTVRGPLATLFRFVLCMAPLIALLGGVADDGTKASWFFPVLMGATIATALVHFHANCGVCHYNMTVATYVAFELYLVAAMIANTADDGLSMQRTAWSIIVCVHLLPFLFTNMRVLLVGLSYVGGVVNVFGMMLYADVFQWFIIPWALATFALPTQIATMAKSGYLLSFGHIMMMIATGTLFFPGNGCGEGATVTI